MAGYLDAYGTSDARREKTLKWIILGGLGLLILATLLYFRFRDYSEQRQISAFLDALRKQDYKAAYVLWGCSDTKPCRDYRLEKFMEDWGPQSSHARANEARIVNTIGCDAGVVADVRFPDSSPLLLWVERSTDAVGFFPWKLRPVPPDWKSQMALRMWEITRNCKPLIE